MTSRGGSARTAQPTAGGTPAARSCAVQDASRAVPASSLLVCYRLSARMGRAGTLYSTCTCTITTPRCTMGVRKLLPPFTPLVSVGDSLKVDPQRPPMPAKSCGKSSNPLVTPEYYQKRRQKFASGSRVHADCTKVSLSRMEKQWKA